MPPPLSITRKSLVLVNICHPLHFFLRQFKIKNLKVFLDMRLIAWAGDCDITRLQMPAQDHLCRSLAVRFGYAADGIIIKKCLRISSSAQWKPGFHDRPVLGNMHLHPHTLMVWMRFVLDQCRNDCRRIHQTVKVLRLIVIGQPDGSQFSICNSLLPVS